MWMHLGTIPVDSLQKPKYDLIFSDNHSECSDLYRKYSAIMQKIKKKIQKKNQITIHKLIKTRRKKEKKIHCLTGLHHLQLAL